MALRCIVPWTGVTGLPKAASGASAPGHQPQKLSRRLRVALPGAITGHIADVGRLPHRKPHFDDDRIRPFGEYALDCLPGRGMPVSVADDDDQGPTSSGADQSGYQSGQVLVPG